MLLQPNIALFADKPVDDILNSKIDDEFELLLVENMAELIGLYEQHRNIELLIVYTDNLSLDCADIRAQSSLAELPVLALGRYISENIQADTLAAGAIDCLDIGHIPALVLEARIRNLYELCRRGTALAEASKLDTRTSLPNRQFFEEISELEWRRCCREFTPLSLLLIDIDAFTAFNQHYGMGVGDNCLKRIAKVLALNCLRAADRVARYEGDEFIILLPGTEYENAFRLAENICRAVSALHLVHEYSDVADQITVSIGVATIDPTQDQSFSILLSEAEDNLQRAQSHGGNQAEGSEL